MTKNKPPTHKKEKDCYFKDDDFIPCDSMNALLDSRSNAGIGAHVVRFTNFKTMEEWDAGVSYNFTRAAAEKYEALHKRGGTELMMNVCPFCNNKILNSKRVGVGVESKEEAK